MRTFNRPTRDSFLNSSEDAPELSVSPVQAARERGVTARVVVLCLGLALLFGYIIPIIDIKFTNTFLGSTHLPLGAIGALLVLLGVVNPLLGFLGRLGERGRSARFAFSRNELLTVYIVSTFAALVPGHGGENFFVSTLIAPFYFSTRENGWLHFLEPHLKSWFSPALADGGRYGEAGSLLTHGWYSGLQPGQSVPWALWLVPLLAWGTLIAVSYFMMACIGVMLRAQWAQREALAFPLLRLPLALTEDETEKGSAPPFFRNPLTWIGFGIAVFVDGVNGLNFYFPDVPPIPMGLDTGSLFTEAPWNQMGPMPIRIMPLVVGITYLLTAETSFSLWFFLLFTQAQLILAYYLGFQPATLTAAIGHVADGATKTFLAYQQVGAFLAYVGFVLWLGREHFSHIARRAFGRAQATPSEKGEAMSYPLAFWGFLLSFAFIIIWSVQAGIRLDVALALWITYLVISIGLTRVVVECGLFVAQQGWTTLGTFAQITGSGPGTWLPASSFVPATFLQASMMTDMRAFLLPSFLQGFKLAHDRGIAVRRMLALIGVVVAISFSMGVWMRVKMGYESGGLGFNGWFAIVGAEQPAFNSQTLLAGATGATPWNLAWLFVGALLIYSLMVARSRFARFPLHPIGFLVALSAPVQRFWFSIFLGWAFKVIITRFGGSDSYRRLTPMFLGLVLGNVAIVLVWLAIDSWQGRTGHLLLP